MTDSNINIKCFETLTNLLDIYKDNEYMIQRIYNHIVTYLPNTLDNELKNSPIAKLVFLAKKLRNPLYVNDSKVSFKEKSVFLYPSLFNANTAFGPTSLPPLIILVK